MDIHELSKLREDHVGFRLLRSPHFPFIASFFYNHFVRNNQRVIDESVMLEAVEDLLFQSPEDLRPHASARDLVRQWVEAKYLRQYYIAQDDIARYELTVAVEKTLDWLHSLQTRSFVGTESRLRTIFELLQQLREQTEKDVRKRVAMLQAERQRISDEIDKILADGIEVLSEVQVKERFAQLEDMARQLLRDFSEVEQNFRQLDRQVRTRIAQQDGHRGDVLQIVFQDSDAIKQSEQGRSFQAFFEFLLSPGRQEELESYIQHVYNLDVFQSQPIDPFLGNLQSRLIDATDKVRSTQNLLSSQLRRFLDEKQRLENTRIHRLIHQIEKNILDMREIPLAEEDWPQLDELWPDIDIPTRSLYRIPLQIDKVHDVQIADDQSVSANALFAQDTIDERRLKAQIRKCLERIDHVSLQEILKVFPLKQGVAELVAYIKIASQDPRATVSRDLTFIVSFESHQGQRSVQSPQAWFSR